MKVMSIKVDNISGSGDPVESKDVEFVERKGLGHPDSICDGIAESVSRRLCEEYRERFDEILHHNTDEVQLVAGTAKPEIGGGEIQEPLYILLAGRAKKKHEGELIPVDEVAVEAAKNYIDNNFQKLSSDHIKFSSRIGETSSDLKSVFERETPLANDTSFGVGHAPLSETEKAVKHIEEMIRREFEVAGDDIKVMALREQDELTVTIAAATISERLDGIDDYKIFKKELKNKVEIYLEAETGLKAEVVVNSADDMDKGSIYTTVTGTSAENGDDGSVGRGNRVNGLITPHRPMSLEAASGKNPVTHVGKIYNLLAEEIAKEIYAGTGCFAQVKILSRIGKPIDEPQLLEIETTSEEKKVVEKIARDKLENVDEVIEEYLNSERSTF